ncbi:N-acetylmuramoyl-L-alanine amidase [Vagococcus elongatus]|uniref:SH3b domain-containing protein n=1 Tax=Vagococcus elongatus TaxID=180344 RepID=A0A430AM39_9ENTE|nr:N-acetylmuramoyl-L-alanine amidase [Vagococcus elongatus]RSU09136.1 hypothetical protein CBF29_12230 [Vagococcus elongatus]
MKKQDNHQRKKKLLVINLIIACIVVISFFSLNGKEFVTVKAMAMNVRIGPGVEHDVVTQVKKGDKLEILQEKGQWYLVKLGDKSEGWIASWLVSEEDATSPSTNIKAYVNTPNTKLRKEASTDSKALDELKNNTEVTITSEKNGWSHVEVNAKTGWIYSELLTPATIEELEIESQKIDKVYARQNGTKIRDQAGIDGSIVTEIDFGDSLTYIASDGDWYQVETSDGNTGYVANWVVSSNEPHAVNENITSIAEATIMIDAGHGGEDGGSESADGMISEKVVTLATARFVQQELKKYGANVILTRDDDTFIPLAEIAAKSNRAKADVFISVHYDSTEEINSASGTTTYYYDESDISLAKIVNEHLASDLPIENRGVEFGDYQVLRENERPSLLLELGYMNSYNDVSHFKTKTYQRKVAKAITNALVEYFE